MLSSANKDWLDAFFKNNGRAPTVLHIGNIANNAYNNAKLLNGAGFDCDVLCYDYYHIMGCPEWEDADFSARVSDDFRPDWFKVAGDFQRPKWFAQGSVLLAIDYLCSRRAGLDSVADRQWQRLLAESKCLPPLKARSIRALLRKKTPHQLQRFGNRCVQHINTIARNDFSTVHTYYRYRLSQRGGALFWPVLKIAIAATHLVTSPLRFYYRAHETATLCQKAKIRAFATQFGDREDQLKTVDIVPYLGVLPALKKLFRHYDVVIGYSTDPLLPMLCDVPYFAFEHGTLRDIPYQKDAQGRLTALSYRMAQHVFVTNFDCKSSAEFLAPGRFTLINHPYDEDHGLAVDGGREMRNKLMGELQCSFLFFHPTRHDWVAGTGYADKQNDNFLRAFAALRAEGFAVGLICCEWGANVGQSKQLLDELGCAEYVKWIAPQAITPFERLCLACDVVVDQFKLGAFGGVVFKAMAVGTPILTFLDTEYLSKQYPAPPPVLNCRTQEEIVAVIRHVFDSPEELKAIGQASRAWMKSYHAKEQTVNAQVNQFRQHLPANKIQKLNSSC